MLGLPVLSFWLLLGVPAIFLVIMLYHCWQIMTGRKD